MDRTILSEVQRQTAVCQSTGYHGREGVPCILVCYVLLIMPDSVVSSCLHGWGCRSWLRHHFHFHMHRCAPFSCTCGATPAQSSVSAPSSHFFLLTPTRASVNRERCVWDGHRHNSECPHCRAHIDYSLCLRRLASLFLESTALLSSLKILSVRFRPTTRKCVSVSKMSLPFR